MSKLFGTDGIRSKVNVEPMTPGTCLKISRSAGFILSKTGKNNRVVISKDTRLSGYVFEPVIASGFSSVGLEVLLVGPLPTPALAMLVGTLRADIGVMITASHNTFEDNGIKLFDKDGYKISRDLEKEIEELVFNSEKYEKINQKNILTGKTKRLEDAVGRYTESIKNSFSKDKNLKGLKIVIDCANGANYKVAPEILWELGCEVITIENFPNGKNINYKCGATNPQKLSNKVIEVNADIGIAFDGDGDRITIVDEKGEIIDGDKIIALLASDYLKKNKLRNNKIVTTHMSNLGFEKYINETLSLELIRTDVGDRNVINKMREVNSSIGGEQSGHIILSDFSKTGDGLLSAIQILDILTSNNKKTSELFNLYHSVPQLLTNVQVEDKIKSFEKEKIDKFIKDTVEKNPNIRLLIRPSGTESKIRILVEGSDIDQIKLITHEAKKIIIG